MTVTEGPKKSRSQQKREMLALEELGLQLVDVPSAQLAGFDLPADLIHAISELRTMKKHGAIRRQKQRIGALMRQIDPEPVAELVRKIREKGREEARCFQKIQRWRDGLLADDQEVWEEISNELAGFDTQHVRALVKNAKKEKMAGKPPRCARQLFAYLRDTASVL